jgi:hypothetical protein
MSEKYRGISSVLQTFHRTIETGLKPDTRTYYQKEIYEFNIKIHRKCNITINNECLIIGREGYI